MVGSININGKDYEFKEGETILEVARRNAVPIPVLCYLKDIAETGACRICLVEAEGVPAPVASCATFAVDGMKIRTDSEELKKHRRHALEFILLKHPLECERCENSGGCQLRVIAKHLGVSEVKNIDQKEKLPLVDWSMFLYNQNLCVVCQRCEKVCREVAGCNALETTFRASAIKMAPKEEPLVCDYCGICADVCPVGAIVDKPFDHEVKISQMSFINSACPFCSVGCRINYGLYDGQIQRTRRSGDGYTCAKGRYGFKFLESAKRIKVPIIKKDGVFHKSSWQEALNAIKDGLTKNSIENSLVILGNRLSNEELFSYKELALKIGMRFITEAELIFGDFMRLYKEKFGRYESLGSLEDIEKSDLIFVVGADFARECVGIKWKVMKAAFKKDAKVITIGLQRYEYDENTYVSLIADNADFASEFEKIKKSDEHIYKSIRDYINEAQSVSIIVGNEYFSGEDDKEAALAFADFIGEDKLKVFMPSSEKINYIGALYLGGETTQEMLGNKPKAVLAVAVNPSKGKLDILSDIIDSAEFYATPEIFVAGAVARANVVVPILSTLECDGSYTTIDGRFLRMVKVAHPIINVKTNIEFAAAIAEMFKKKLETDPRKIFEENAKSFGFDGVSFDNKSPIYRKSERSFKKTNYEYSEKPKRHKDIYVNPRYHEGVLTMISELEKEQKSAFPIAEDIIMPSVKRSHEHDDNIAKGVALIPRKVEME